MHLPKFETGTWWRIAMSGTVELFEFQLRLPGGSSFPEQIQANNRPQAEQVLKSRYGAGLIILSYKILRRLGSN